MTELTCERAQVVGTVHRAMNDVKWNKKGRSKGATRRGDTYEYGRKRKGGVVVGRVGGGRGKKRG